jgi:hypothetical protein
MTISTTTISKSYSGDGSTHSFAYDFPIFAEGDLTVIIRSSTGTETVKTLNTHYVVTGAGVSSGGTVLFKYNTGTSSDAHYSSTDYRPASGETVVIRSELANTQTMDLVANDPFPAETLETNMDKLVRMVQQHEEELDRSLKLSRTNTMTSTEFTNSATDRANKLMAFDSAGEIVVTQEIGTFKGNWAASTAYVQRDIVKDTSTNNIFICITAHTSSGSQPLTTNTDSAKWSLIVDAASATTSQTAAATSATLAGNYATKVDGVVTGSDYSAKAWSVGGTGVTDTSSAGAAKEWATETSGTVDGTSYSSKEYAQGTQSSTGGSAKSWAQDTDQVNGAGTNDRSAKNWAQGSSMTGSTLGGSSKDWAQLTGSTVDGTNYSAKYHASASATSATASATSASTASDHRADAGKYAVTAEDSTFSLTSTNGSTSGLYSALHYQAKAQANQTAAANSATAAANSATAAASSASSLTTGISNGNILACNANVVNNDFLKIDGTSVEGRSASEVVSDIGAATQGFSIAMAICL